MGSYVQKSSFMVCSWLWQVFLYKVWYSHFTNIVGCKIPCVLEIKLYSPVKYTVVNFGTSLGGTFPLSFSHWSTSWSNNTKPVSEFWTGCWTEPNCHEVNSSCTCRKGCSCQNLVYHFSSSWVQVLSQWLPLTQLFVSDLQQKRCHCFMQIIVCLTFACVKIPGAQV